MNDAVMALAALVVVGLLVRWIVGRKRRQWERDLLVTRRRDERQQQVIDRLTRIPVPEALRARGSQPNPRRIRPQRSRQDTPVDPWSSDLGAYAALADAAPSYEPVHETHHHAGGD